MCDLYETSRRWADNYVPELAKILRKNAMHLISVVTAPDEYDLHYATDLVIKIEGGDVATRVRKPDCKFRDLTIRSRTRYNNPTEIHKIRNGFAKWYLYAWTGADEQIESWILVNLDNVRKSGLLDRDRKDIPNGDGTWFINIELSELDTHKCILSEYGLDELQSVDTIEGNYLL